MNILLGVTGSVAGTVIHKLVEQLLAKNHQVEILATERAYYFLKPQMREFKIWTEQDEWPGQGYQKGQVVKHIELRDWADVLVIAPLTANTMAKIANGMCDNLLTSVARAWILERPLVIAPAMNTQMWLHPVTSEHLAKLQNWYNLITVPPRAKELACGELGIGAMAEVEDIIIALTGGDHEAVS